MLGCEKDFKKLCALAIITSFGVVNLIQPQNILAVQSEVISNGVEVIQEGKRSILFNNDWRFFKGNITGVENPDFSVSFGRLLDLPHDWSIEEEFTTQGEAESGFLLGGTAWYRKDFVIPENLKDKEFILNFDGVCMNAEVYVNGKLLGEHNYGYSAFAFNITDELFIDGKTENVIEVKVKNPIPTSRWYSGSGIYRDVTLNIKNKIHVAHLGTTVTTPNLKSQQNSKTDVVLKVNVENDKSEAKDVKLRSVVLDSNDNEVSEAVELSKQIPSKGNLDFEQNLIVSNPKLWSTDSPNLYRVKSDVIVDGEVVDTYYTTFGFRYFDFDKDSGFSLNGKKMKLRGVSMHHDQGALGSAS